jgi:glycolate oxidase iron-sulfur subunit
MGRMPMPRTSGQIVMMEQTALDDMVSELDRCTNCGLCHGICPVYLVSGEESTSARGKINLLRALHAGELAPNAHLVDIFNRCLLCYGCQSVCPAGVRTENLWISSREFLARRVGQSLAKKVVLAGFLARPEWMRLVLKLVGILQAITFSRKIQYRHLPSGLTIPRLSSKTLLDDLPERIPAATMPALGRVGYFVGCMSNYLLPGIANSAIRVLSKLGYEVVIPHQQVCCGAPAFNNGDFKSARKLALWNIRVFLDAKVDMIVTPDATCGGAFTHEYGKLFDSSDPDYQQFKNRCQEIMSLVSRRLSDRAIPLHPVEELITIHDSCHLTHTQGMKEAPRTLLQAIPGVEIAEKLRSNHCCGFGGSYMVLYPNESENITGLRISEILKTGAATVVASSPGCILKLREQADRERVALRVVHPLELLDESLKA